MSHWTELDVYRCPLDGINLIEASAGTGKTWNICGLYLRLLLERELEVQRILVVTFTNAATAELRERIRARIVETLDFLADNRVRSGDPFVPQLISTLLNQRGMAEDDIRRRLDLALETFDEAAIFTIHGFCQRALADNPFAAGLPMSLDLVTDDAELRMQVVHDFWRRHIGNPLAAATLDPDLAAYLVEQGDTPETLAALLQRHLAKPLAGNLWPDTGDDATQLDSRELTAAYEQARSTWAARSEEIIQVLLNKLSQLNANSYKEAGVRTGAQEWEELFRTGAPLAIPGEKYQLFTSATLKLRTKSKCTTPVDPFFDQAETYLEQRKNLAEQLALARLRLIRALLQEAGEGLRELKRARRVVSFDDMLFNLHERLSNGAYPWLAESIRTRFPAALIDEFQDTDPLQFAIFHTIYGAGDAPLFLVGDPKQAIYSFRHADLHTYLQARQHAGTEYSLVANQRSSAGLLNALNLLFAANPQAFMLPGLDYRPVEFGSKPRKPFVDQTEARADLQLWMLHDPSQDAPGKQAAKRAIVAATAGEIARLIRGAAAGRITLGERPLQPGDMAVLVRSHAQGSEMKRALAALGVGSVELSQASVFQSVDAEEVERVLRAILEPGREGLVRAALATELMGCIAADVVAISADETRLMQRLGQFNEWRETWLKRGFGIMYRRLLVAERVAERMLARPDGERRLTNFLHLGECLHQAAETHAAPDALLRYLESQRREGAADEAAQLRLESDQNLVQIVTIHKSKGLEYPIVFCPFLWDGRTQFGGPGMEGREYHDEDGVPVIDWRGDDIDDLDAIKARIKEEQAAENLRLIYVALTRAVYRCYLVAGCYSIAAFGRPSATESARSMLNWLVAGAGQDSAAWFKNKLTAEDITAAWTRLAENPHIGLAPLPTDPGIPIDRPLTDPERLRALEPPAFIPKGWRVSSYSGLSHGAISEQAASDHDAHVDADREASPPRRPGDDILDFPRGAAAGDCIHAVFEHLDFTDETTWASAMAGALQDYPQTLPGNETAPAQAARLTRMLENLVRDVTTTTLATDSTPGFSLNRIPRRQRLSELEFSLPARHLTAETLNDTLRTLGYPGPRLTFHQLQGYLKGYIDLVFEHQGRWYILDWKSNYLGDTPADYTAEPLASAMAEHGYHLQYLLYTVALDRFLRRRIPGYQYETHFGGVHYLFVRGVRPHWPGAGIYSHRPAASTLATLNALLDSTHEL